MSSPPLLAIRLLPGEFPRSDVFPFDVPVIRESDTLGLHAPVTFFAGDNGSGKSTLLSAIARRANIHIWKGLRRARYRRSPYEDALYRYIRLEWSDGIPEGSFFAGELFRDFSQLLDEWASSDPGVLKYFGNHSLMTLSHGEGHLAFFRNRFSRPGLYLLDEPENALSPSSRLAFLEVLEESARHDDRQFIIATHCPIILSFRHGQIMSFDHVPIREIPYHDTEHFKVYRSFFSSG